jgi:SET domain-containing protein
MEFSLSFVVGERRSGMVTPLAVHDGDDLPAARLALIPGKGRGVVASRRIEANEIFERAHVLVLPRKEAEVVLGCEVLASYVYGWGESVAIALGHGSLFNHSYEPNVVYTQFIEEQVLEFAALVDIEEGAELCINYGGHPADRSPVWFDIR